MRKGRSRWVLFAGWAVLAVGPAPSLLACSCDEVPFSRLVADADFVLIGRVANSETGEAVSKAGERPDPKWISTIEVTRVIKGSPPSPFRVGGFGSSCAFAPPVLRDGDVYAFAFKARSRVPRGFYWLEMCNEGAVGIKGESRDGKISVEEVVRWAGRRALLHEQQPQNKWMQLTRSAHCMDGRGPRS